jgi:uncharacterized protein YndB with AHSA1/START domain
MTTTTPHRLERSVLIRARRETVFSFFTRDDRFATWWGAGSTIDPRPGGRFLIRYPGGVQASGEVIEIAPPDRIVLSYGYAGNPTVPPGSTRVTVALSDEAGGTRVSLVHELADAAARDEHVQGWRYQLSVFGNVVADLVHAEAARPVDVWFSAWSVPEPDAITQLLAPVVVAGVQFRDRYSVIDGAAELAPHIAAAQRFMPGLDLRREGPIRQVHGVVLADWVAVNPMGERRAEGTNVFVLDADSRIEQVTAFWSRAHA